MSKKPLPLPPLPLPGPAVEKDATHSTGAPIANGIETFSRYVDPAGRLNFGGKAIVHAQGVDFSEGSRFQINLAELEIQDELGRGQYGVVNRVYHRPTRALMALKQIRLGTNDIKTFEQIVMELEVLHRSSCPYIVDFYGAFFIESTVYICLEYMDARSLSNVYGSGVPEPVLARIAESMVRGLKFLKDKLSIIHRGTIDYPPWHCFLDTLVKLCDFGVSGQLIQSMAKTHVGCQNYMAPERIMMGDKATYTVASDVWSLGMTLWEAAMGQYPFPSGKFDSVFAQLSAIVSENPAELDPRFSEDARGFVKRCLTRAVQDRPTYAELLQHSFLLKYRDVNVDMADWVKAACDAS